jgi:hypothetical protein
MKILMLDLECTLTSVISGDLKYTSRPHGMEFLLACIPLFDTIYLNTAVPEGIARKVIKDSFGVTDIKFWDWHGHPGKTYGYETIQGNTIVQVDDCVSEDVLRDFERFGVYYIRIPAYDPSKDRLYEDDGLLKALAQIHWKIVQRNLP